MCRGDQVFVHGQMFEDPRSHHDERDPRPDDVSRIQLGDLHAVEADVPFADLAVFGRKQAHDRFEGRGLAGSVRAEQSDEITTFHLQGQAAQHEDHLVVDHLDVVDIEKHAGGRGGFNRPCRIGHAPGRHYGVISEMTRVQVPFSTL
ncbi:hypothetical protein BMS3Bbin01_03092 [bacterium BMS3Bbin01]|nr:hypothetical protein BMS3Bbin01_03092 [bacterium BMS3Bbin01]